MSKNLPQGWNLVALSNVCSGIRGVAYSPSDLKDQLSSETVTLLRSNNIQENGLVTSDVQYVDKKRVRKNQIALPGDIAVCMSNGSKRLVGKSASFGMIVGDEQYTVGAFCSIFRPTSYDGGEFLRQFFKSDAFQRQVDFSLAGSAINNLKNSDIEEYDFLQPSLPEQKKIAAILTAVDNVIESTQAQINKLKDLKTGMMQELLTKGIGHTEFKDSPVGQIPKGWNTRKIQDISSYITSGSRGWAEYYSKNGAIFIRIGNLTRENINLRFNDVVYVNPPENGEGMRTLVQVGDVLISITADLGIIGVVNESVGEAYVNQHVCLVRLGDIGWSRWVGHYLANEAAQKQFNANNDSGAKAGLNLSSIRSLEIALPPENERNKIVNALDSVDSDIVNRRRKLQRLLDIKKALMQDLLTGKVRVKVD